MKMKHYFITLKSTKASAFTLVECLVALIVLSGTLLVYQSLTRSLSDHVNSISNSRMEDWQLFTHQFYLELETAEFEKIEQNSLYLKQGQKHVVFQFTKQGEFKKRNSNGKGHHPMLFNLSNGQITQEDKIIKINFFFQSGLTREFYYDFSEKS